MNRAPDHAGKERLVASHHPDAIRDRLAAKTHHSYRGDALLGSIDGCVTTFAVVSGAVGGGLSNVVILILGIANLVADGLSMAVGNYQSKRAQIESIEQAWATEASHIEQLPEGEREEIRQIFAAKGFEGKTLEKVIDVITHNREVWIDTMLKEEIHVHPETPHALRAAFATFAAFVVVGSVPLMPFVFGRSMPGAFLASALATGVTFFGIGAIKGIMLGRPIVQSGWSTFLPGAAAAAVAYFIASWLRQMFGSQLS
jgi:VIT1/CCC1 family predicted Fe2+/Mn2+ transporter